MIRICVGTRLGARTCEPRTCPCSNTVDARGLHGLSCRKKCSQTSETFQSGRHYLESIQKSSDFCCKWTGGPISIRRQTTWWSHTNSLGKGKSSHLGSHGTWHICTVTCIRHCNFGRSSYQSCCHKKDIHLSTSDQTPKFLCHLLSNPELYGTYKPSSSLSN